MPWQPALDLEAQTRAGRVGHTLSEAHDWQALAVLSLAWDPAQLHSKERAWTRMQAKAQALRLEARTKADAVVLAELDHALVSWLGRRSAVEARLAGTQAYRRRGDGGKQPGRA